MTDEPARCRLVSFLGTGKYQPVVYRDAGSGTTAPMTPWVAHALAELHRPDEILILATPTAEEKHGQALHADLKAAGFAAQLKPIDEGGEPANLWQQFAAIKETLRAPAGTRILLDITHGFRSQPFFAAAVVAFVRAVDPQPAPLRIVYGGFEARDASGIAPIWDLTPFVDLLDWTREIMLFLKTGRAAGVAERTGALARAVSRAWFESGKSGRQPSLQELAKAIEAFGGDLETVRTGSLLLGDGKRAGGTASRLVEAIAAVRDEVGGQVPPLADVLDRVEAMARPLTGCSARLNDAKGNAALVALAQLYVDMGRYAEAATTVREGLITQYAGDEAACPGLDAFSPDRREEAEQLWYKRDRDLGRRVAGLRNDIDHGGYRKRPLSAAKLRDQITRLVEDFSHAEPKPACGCEAIFVNISNHPSDEWDEQQRSAALALAPRIVDLPFPPVPPEASAEALATLAEQLVAAVPEAVSHALVQGEFTLAFRLVRALKGRGVRCYAATSHRAVDRTPDGHETRHFRFVAFREYMD